MTLQTLQEYLSLNRPNFQINPKQSFDDASLYFGKARNEEIIAGIETGYMAGLMPRMYVFGNYGTGKTHLLYHLKHHFEREADTIKVVPIVVQVEAESKTRYQALHKRFLEGIGLERLQKAYMDYRFSADEPERRFSEMFGTNTYKVMQLLNAGPAMAPLAWRWLTAERLSAKEQQDLGVTAFPSDTGELVDLLVTIGELFKKNNQHLLFLVDESEALKDVTNADSQASWHEAFRRLADTNDNQSIGWILTFYATDFAAAPDFMLTGDITTRLGKSGQIVLESLRPVEVKGFLTDLLKAFVDRQKAAAVIAEDKLATTVELYPFTDDGLSAFVQHAGAAQENAIPRTILRAVTACALEALRKRKRVLDKELVDITVPNEFAELG